MKVHFPSYSDYGVYDGKGNKVGSFIALSNAWKFVSDCWVEGEGMRATIVDELTGEVICEFADDYGIPTFNDHQRQEWNDTISAVMDLLKNQN